MKTKSLQKQNFREIINSMFNLKMFCLMKKHVYSLMMVLALVVLAGTNAWAQDGLSVGTAYWHLPGSTHGVQVASHTNTSYTWAITKAGCDGSAGAAVEAGTTITTGSNTATITYAETAAGTYRITCTEATTGDGLCSTIRQFYTAIMSIDVIVNASDAAGATISGAALTGCNDYSLLNSGSTLVGNADTDDNTNSLGSWQNTNLYNQRWVNVSLSVADQSGCTVASAPAASDFAWQFNYTIAGTNYPANFITMQPVTGVTYTDATDVTSTIDVAAGTTSITLPLRSYIRWGTTDTDMDQDFTFTVDTGSAKLDGSDGDSTYDDGTEPTDATTIANNVSASQHIDAAPATPRITIND